MVPGILKIALRLRDQHVSCFQHFNFEADFWKTKTFFKKLEYRFLVESTKIDNASIPYKTAISETNVATNRMVTTKWSYHKERSFASNYLFFWKFCFSLRTSYKELIWCAAIQVPIYVLFESAGVLLDGAFSLWVSLIISLMWVSMKSLVLFQ